MKTGWKKLAIWALVISTLSGVVVGSQVMAIKTSEALEKMKEAGKIQLVTNVFSKCVQGRIDQPYKDTQEMHVQGTTSTIPKTPLADNPFNELRKHIPVGAWLEKQVQGKINNGTIYCEDKDSNIVNVFANTLGIDKAAIYCDGKNPGIFKLQNQNSKGEWVDVEGECAAGLNNSDLKFVFNDDGALAHVKKLYNKKKQDNSYLVAWGDRGTFSDDLINYFLYFNDFAVACSSDPFSGDENLLNKTKYFGPVKVPNPSTGNMDERYYSKGHITSNSWGSNWINSDGAHTCDAVIKRINDTAPAVKKALDKTEKDDDGTKPDDVVGDITEEAGDETSTGEQASPCSTAAASLGWIICPVIQALGNAVDGLYAQIENNYLRTDVEYVGDDSGTYEAWESFRDYANIAFVIMLVVIILSQITGLGVSNYGIKKMLPSLIVVAILVNISFFLCQVAVDVSNIVGASIKDLFDGISVGTPADFGDGGIGDIVSSIIVTLFTIGGGVGVIAALIATAELWILPFLLTLLVAVIGVVFFFLLLGLRQACIIVLVTLCPLAIICYALPNTKSIFSRWWKLFSALLLVYPICGLLMGGGRFASRLLLTNMSKAEGTMFFGALIAVLIQVIPFFFIPSILKSSFAAMGNLGMRLSNFGRNLGRGATGAIRHSEGFRDTQARMAGHNAQRTLNRMNKTTGIRGRVNSLGKRVRDGDGRIAEMANNSRNRKMNRLQGAVLAQNLANRDRSGAFTQRHVAELAKDYTDTWENDGTFAEESSAAAQLESALNDLRTDHENVDARARFTSAMRNLNTSDAGRQYVDSVLNGGVRAAALAGQTSNKGIQWAASAVRNAAGGDYKAKNPTTFKNLNKLASGSYAYDANDIISTTDKDGHEFLANKNYLNDKARDIGAEQLMNTDDMYRRNAIQGIQNGTITGDARNNLIAQAREVMNNPNLTPKGDVARDMDALANMDYAPPTGSVSSNASASTVDGGSVRRMASASQGELDRIVRGVENGTIGTNNVHTGANDRAEIANVAEATLNAANAGTVSLSQETADKLNRIRALDGRSEIAYTMRVQHNSGNSAPVPSGFEENGSGIVIPRNGQNGDRTGSQIRDFERQMRQHNNGGDNNGGGGIILP